MLDSGKEKKMSDISGRSFGTPLARYDRDTRSWRTSEATCLWDLPMCLETLPNWGCLHDGVLYEQPTPEPPIVEHASSSLPTPKAADGERGRDLPRLRPDQSARELATAVGLLATPTAWLGRRPAHAVGNPSRWHDAARSNELSDQIATILPTPMARDYKDVSLPPRLWGPKAFHEELPTVIARLLPTPAVNDMGAGKDPQVWEDWAARQKAADGSLEQEALKMLPTPRSVQWQERNQAIYARPDGPQNLENALHGVITQQPSPAGNGSWDDPHQPQLFPEPTEPA